jgi:hypothetical protein
MNDCKNNYTSSTFYESFGKDDNDLKKCNNCPYMNFDDGMITCEKFNGGSEDENR